MRTTAVVGILAGFLGAGVCLSGCQKRTQAPEIEGPNVRIDLGTANCLDPDGWSQLRVLLRNQGETFRGELEVVGFTQLDGIHQTEDPVRYRMQLEVPGGAGAFRQVNIPVRAEGWSEFEVRLFQPGYGKAFRTPVQPGSSPSFRILVIEDESHDISPWVAALGKELEDAGGQTGVHVIPEVVKLGPERCPTIADGYSPFHVVLLHGPTLEGATEEALGALEEWVRSGGTVVAIPGPSWGGNLPARLREILGVDHVSPENGVTPHADARLSPALTTFTWTLGAGQATTLTRPLGGRKDPSQNRLLGVGEIKSALAAAAARSYAFAGSASAGLRTIEKGMHHCLSQFLGMSVPPAGLIFLCLLAYAFLGCVLPYKLFKRRKRTEWAYAVMLGAALMAIGLIWGFGALTSLHEAQANEVTIVRLTQDGKSGRATSFVGLAAPGFRKVDIFAGLDRKSSENSPEPSFSRVRAQPCRGGDMAFVGGREVARIRDTTVRLEADGAQRLDPFTLYPNSLESLRIDSELTLKGAIRVEGANSGKDDETRIVNASDQSVQVSLVEPARFTNWFQLEPGGAKSLAELRANGQVLVNRDPSVPNLPSAPGEYPVDQAPWWVHTNLRSVLWNPRGELNAWNPGAHPPPLPAAWAEVAPRYVIVSSSRPLLPEIQGFASRKAITCYVIELAPEGAP